MKKYLLDTNICIHFLKNEYKIVEKMAEVGFEHCYISELTLAELLFGLEYGSPERKERNLQNYHKLMEAFGDNIVPIRVCFEVYAIQKASLKRVGQTIGEFDMLIGCSALVKEMTLVTRNTKHLERIEGLLLENWVDA